MIVQDDATDDLSAGRNMMQDVSGGKNQSPMTFLARMAINIPPMR